MIKSGAELARIELEKKSLLSEQEENQTKTANFQYRVVSTEAPATWDASEVPGESLGPPGRVESRKILSQTTSEVKAVSWQKNGTSKL